MILKICAGERILSEYVRVVLSGCMKVAALKAVVYTIPSKAKGLRVQTSDIILGEPGVGKNQSFQWRDDRLVEVKKYLLKYADDELRKSMVPAREPPVDGDRARDAGHRRKFKYVDGIERLCDMDLPFLIDLPNGSAEAVFLTASKNAGCGCVPIMEWCNGRRTVLDRDGKNGVFLASHDPTMKALIYKTVESVPEIIGNTVF